MMRGVLAALLLLCAGAAQAQVPSVAGLPCNQGIACNLGSVSGAINGTNFTQVAPRSNILPWHPSHEGSTSTTFYSQTGGRDSLGAIEAPDDYVAVQFVFANFSGSAAWGVQGVASASASYGATTTSTPGITPYDGFGTAQTAMLPITFNQAGAWSTPWNGLPQTFTGSASSGVNVIALATTGAATGATSLPFASTTAGLVQGGGLVPVAGMYAYDGLGCIQAGTKVTAVTSTSITISPGVSSSTACASGQSIYFAWPSTLALTQSVGVTPNAPAPALTYSDWIPIQSAPRVDGGEVAGMAVSGTNIPAGDTIASLTNTTVTLAQAPSGTIAAGTAITFSAAPTVSAAVAQGYVLHVSSTFGIKAGSVITGANIASSTNVVETGSDVSGPYIRLSQPISGAVAPGEHITASLTASLISAASSASPVLQFASTTAKPLLLFRAVASGGDTAWIIPGNAALQAGLGLPIANFFDGPQSGGNAKDTLNYIANAGNGNGPVASYNFGLVYAVNFLTIHKGVVVAVVGDSHYAGDTTATNNANFVARAAAALDSPTVPVAFLHSAFGGETMNQFGWMAENWIRTVQPGVVVLDGYTYNNVAGVDSVGDYLMRVQALIHDVQSYGGVAIVGSDFPRQSPYVWSAYTTAAVNNSTTVPIAASYASYIGGSAGANISGLAISGPGIPSGTTATITKESGAANVITLSQPATIPAGSILRLDQMTVATTTTSSTSVTFTTPPPIGEAGLTAYVNGAALSGTLSVTQGSTTGTFTTAQSLPAGTVVSLGTTVQAQTGPVASQQAAQIAAGIINMAAGGSIQTFDTLPILEDPANPTWYLPQYTLDGIHANDNGHAALAAAFEPLLRRAVGE